MKKITKIGVNETLIQKKKRKVAAYCRVSTASDEQLISLEAQKAHYENYIRSNDEWEYVGLYYDEGITGTKKDVRAGLTKKNGKWGAGAVKAILTNEKYTGDVIFQKTYSDSSFNRHINYGERDRFFCENHHEPIISHEDFDRVRMVLDQRAMEKGNGTDTYRYQNRYCFSGRIKCGECGDTFKRRQHYKPSGNYVAWTCATHLEKKEKCSMLYISDEGIKLAFLTMLNKLVYGHQSVLKPLLRTLRRMDDKDRLLRIQELEICIEGNTDRKQVLTSLMATGVLEPTVFNKENTVLVIEEQKLRAEKEKLMNYVGGDKTRMKELQKLMSFTSKGRMLTEFEDDIFLAFVESITVESRAKIVFHLKCGLNLAERLVI